MSRKIQRKIERANAREMLRHMRRAYHIPPEKLRKLRRKREQK